MDNDLINKHIIFFFNFTLYPTKLKKLNAIKLFPFLIFIVYSFYTFKLT